MMETLVTSLDPPTACCTVDTSSSEEEEETTLLLQLTGRTATNSNENIRIDLDSLSVVRSWGDDETAIVPLLRSNSSLSAEEDHPLVRRIQKIRRLRERLRKVAFEFEDDDGNSNEDDGNDEATPPLPPLVDFRRCCHAVFAELRNALMAQHRHQHPQRQQHPQQQQQHRSAAVASANGHHGEGREQQQSSSSGFQITSMHARQVAAQLSALGKTFGPESVCELSRDCRTVRLRYEDAGQRKHDIVLDLTNKKTPTIDCFESQIANQYFPFEQHQRGRNDYDDSDDGDAKPTRASGNKKRKVVLPQQSSIQQQQQQQQQQEDPAILASSNAVVDAYRRFCSKIDSYQPLYEELAALDSKGQVLDEISSSPWTVTHRRLRVTDQVSVVLTLDAQRPRHRPTNLQWVGTTTDREAWASKFDASRWNPDRSVLDNLDVCCGSRLPRRQVSSDGVENAEQHALQAAASRDDDCAICFSKELDADVVTGTTTSDPKHPSLLECETCKRLFHNACLRKWLDSLTTSRISFDMIIGSCPCCKQPITAPIR